LIILDANQLLANKGLRTPAISVLVALAGASGHRLAVPQTAADEYLAEYERDLEKLCKETTERVERLGRQCPEWGASFKLKTPDVVQTRMKQERILRALIEVLPLPPGAAEAALLRETLRRLPASSGQGARDVAIWLTTLAYSRPGDRTLLVSADKRAFGAEALHPELLAEASAAGLEVVLCSTIDDAFDALGQREPLSNEAAQRLAADPNVREAVRDALVGPAQLLEVMGAVPASREGVFHISYLGLSDEHTFEPRIVGAGKICRVGERAWVSLTIDWIVNVWARTRAPEVIETWRVERRIRSTVLTEVDAENRAIDAQLVSRAAATVTQAYVENVQLDG